MSTNAELIAEANAFTSSPMLGKSQWRELDKSIGMLRRMSAALEAAEAELTRRDVQIRGLRERQTELVRLVAAATPVPLHPSLAAAPVSLEVANTTLAQVIADALGWDWEAAPGVPSPAEAVSDVAAAVEQHWSLEAVKAETTTEDLREWADYFEHIGSQVGDPQFTQELVVRTLRGPRPFGADASTEGGNRG